MYEYNNWQHLWKAVCHDDVWNRRRGAEFRPRQDVRDISVKLIGMLIVMDNEFIEEGDGHERELERGAR